MSRLRLGLCMLLTAKTTIWTIALLALAPLLAGSLPAQATPTGEVIRVVTRADVTVPVYA